MTVVCSIYHKNFSKNSNLVRHIARIHSESRPSKPSTNHSFICAHCTQTFSRKRNLKRHILLVHAPIFNKRCKIKCMYCISNGLSKKFATRKLLQEHYEKVHNVELQEEIKIFSSKSGRKNLFYTFRMQLSNLV